MRLRPCHTTQLALVFIVSGVIGASATEPNVSPGDLLAPLARTVAEKASCQSVVLVIRPDTGGVVERPSAVAAIRDAVLHAMQDAKVNISTSEAADVVLRDQTGAGVPTVAGITPALTAAKADLVLCGVVHRAGDSHKIAFTLLGAHGVVTQLSVVMTDKAIPSTSNDVDLASAAIAQAIQSMVSRTIDPAQTAEVKTLLVAVAPKSPADAATAGFEDFIFDTISTALREKNIRVEPLVGAIGSAAIQPAMVARMKDQPADSAVMLVSYTRHPGGTLVNVSIVSSKAKLAAESAGLNNWDVAAMPAFPVLNMKVLAYSEAQKATKVGNGECWTLAAEALNSAKARPANGYTFGRKLAAGETIYPGDIMQFTEAKFEGKTSNGGSWWVTMGSPNHTAVVRKVLGPTKYEILEQNPGPVKAATIDFKDLKSGKWEAWRPQAR